MIICLNSLKFPEISGDEPKRNAQNFHVQKSKVVTNTSHSLKMEFSIKDFLSKCGQISKYLWIWSHLLKKNT